MVELRFLEVLKDDKDFQNYDRYYKLNPDGNLLRYNYGRTNILQLNKSLNKNSFLTLGFIRYNKLYKHRVYDDWENYVHSDLNNQETPLYSFSTGGLIQNIFQRQTITDVAKFDYTNQINNIHQLKFGMESKKHRVDYENFNLQYNSSESFNPEANSPFVAPIIWPIELIATF